MIKSTILHAKFIDTLYSKILLTCNVDRYLAECLHQPGIKFFKRNQMNIQAYRDEILLKLTGYVLESEIVGTDAAGKKDYSTLDRIINSAFDITNSSIAF